MADFACHDLVILKLLKVMWILDCIDFGLLILLALELPIEDLKILCVPKILVRIKRAQEK